MRAGTLMRCLATGRISKTKTVAVLALCILGFGVLCSQALGQANDEGSALLKEGWTLYSNASTEAEMKAAVQKYEAALGIFQKTGNVKGVALAENRLGLVYRVWGDYARAEELFKGAISGADATNNQRLKGTALANLGGVYHSSSRYVEALECYEKALAISRELGDERVEVQALTGLGNVYGERAEYDKATESHLKALPIAQKLGDRIQEGWVLNNLGWIYYNRGKSKSAKENYDKSLTIARELKNPKLEVVVLNNMGVLHRLAGRYKTAEQCYEEVLSIAERIGDRRRQSWALNNLGLVWFALGRHGKAAELYEKALAVKRNIGDLKGESQTLNNLGLLYSSWGQYPKAADYYETALEIKKRIGDPSGEANTLNNMGLVYQAWGLNNEALERFRESLALCERLGLSTARPKDLMGSLYLDMGRVDEAEPLLKAAGYHGSLGRFYFAKSEYDRARDHYEKLRIAAEKTGNNNGLFMAYTGLGKVYEALEDYEKAEQLYEKGMNVTEELRSELLPSERKYFFDVKIGGFDRSEPARGLTRVRMKLNRGSQSIVSSEATRARAFADNLSQRSHAGYSGVPKDVLDKEEDLVVRVAALKKTRGETSKDTNAERWENLTADVRKAEEEVKSFIERLWLEYPSYAAVRYPRPVSLKEAAVDADERIVIFDVLGDGIGVKLVVGKEIAETFYKRWDPEDLEKDIRKFLTPFDKAELDQFDPELANSLYKRLLSQVLAEVPKGASVTIVPDGILALLPFEALVVSGTAEWKTGKYGDYPQGLTYLGDEHPISYYESITALTLVRKAQRDTRKAVRTLVIADPIFAKDDERLKTASGEPEPKFMAGTTEKLMAVTKQTGLSFDRLPLTAKLGESLKKLDPDKTDVLQGSQASKPELFSGHLADYRVMVFATHGYFGNDIPEVQEPVLALSFVESLDPSNGFLRMTEVMGLNLNADIVALTACQTGLGKTLSGEGVMSMGRAFQYAGARSVLMSLWSIAESPSIQLVESFFRHLKSGADKLRALALAREEIRRAGYVHPFYWAPFILVGETR